MATSFMEAGSAATQGLQWWRTTTGGSGTVASDAQAVKGSSRSIKFHETGSADNSDVYSPDGTAGDAGRRVTSYWRFDAIVASTPDFMGVATAGFAAVNFALGVNSAGHLVIFDKNFAVAATGTATLAANTDYRISFVYTITSAAVNTVQVYVDGVADVAATNITMITASSVFYFGANNPISALNAYVAHIYIDDGTSGDFGDVRVTAKRPFANGTANNFTTQIGSGGSGYGSGHAPQVNERPLSETNGWAMIGAGSAITEEYAIESASAGDADLTGVTIIDFEAWMWAKALANETASLITAGSSSNAALTSTPTLFTHNAGSTTYPSGGNAVGIITTTALTTVSLYECGILVAYIQPSTLDVATAAAIASGHSYEMLRGTR